jgi:hypothetical protein
MYAAKGLFNEMVPKDPYFFNRTLTFHSYKKGTSHNLITESSVGIFQILSRNLICFVGLSHFVKFKIQIFLFSYFEIEALFIIAILLKGFLVTQNSQWLLA